MLATDDENEIVVHLGAPVQSIRIVQQKQAKKWSTVERLCKYIFPGNIFSPLTIMQIYISR